MDHVTLCTSLVTLKTLRPVSRNVVLVPLCERLRSWSQDSQTRSRLPLGKLTFHSDCEASRSAHAEHHYTPIALEAAAWESGVGLLICCSSQ